MKRAFAALAAATLVATGAPHAEGRTVVGNVSDVAVESLDAGRTVDLSIRKAAGNPFDEPRPGTLPDGGPAGFTFTLQCVGGVDLTTADGWEAARTYDPDRAPDNLTGPAYTAVTDGTGTARFEGLPVGLYYVVETPPDTPGYSWSYGAPFLITLPVGDFAGRDWEYHVTMTAKSGLTSGKTPAPETPAASVTPPGDTPAGTTPAAPSTPPAPGKRPLPVLASTGAGVVGIVLAGMALTVAGLCLSRRKRMS